VPDHSEMDKLEMTLPAKIRNCWPNGSHLRIDTRLVALGVTTMVSCYRTLRVFALLAAVVVVQVGCHEKGGTQVVPPSHPRPLPDPSRRIDIGKGLQAPAPS
jgi:hypothetical protein